VKIYERHYSKTQNAATTSVLLALDFPYEAKLQKFVVQQTVGTAVNFAASVYNSDPDGLAANVLSKFTAIPEQSAAAGDAISVFGVDYVYRNMEGTPTNPVAKIYVVITATAASGGATWEVAIGGDVITSN
jgi:hypothetical protein